METQPLPDLSKAKTGGMASCLINKGMPGLSERLNLRLTVHKKTVWGSLGIFEYNLTKIYEGLKSGRLSRTDWDIFSIADDEDEFYGYKPIRSIMQIKDYVHRFKIGNKDVLYVINYQDKLWTCHVYAFFPNPHTWHTGGVFYSVEEYIEDCKKDDEESAKRLAETNPEWGKTVFN